MKYKVLITGKNTSIIDDFFSQASDDFETVTTSNRYDDIIRHLSFFKPDVFVYCISGEARDSILQMANAGYRMKELNIPVVLVGLKEECDEVEKMTVNLSKMTLYRPISVPAISARLKKLLEERRKEKPETGFKVPDLKELERGGFFGLKPQALSADAPDQEDMPEGKLSGRKHVLVVDDNSMMLKLIKEHLHEKYDVATAVSGKIALKFLERKKTDLILLDYEMPIENGPEVLKKLRANEMTKDIPVVFLTGVTETKKIQEVLLLKPQSYLLKPVKREKLLSTIESLIGE